jgi:hypothetical protein
MYSPPPPEKRHENVKILNYLKGERKRTGRDR